MLDGKPKLTLEEYATFFNSRNRKMITVEQLNQVLSMHGFVRFRTKKAIMAALGLVDLLPPTRSTIRDRRVSPCAALEVNEVREVLQSIGWQECPVGAVLDLTSASNEEDAEVERLPSNSSSTGRKKSKSRSIAAVYATSASPSWGKKKTRKRSLPSPKLPPGSPLLPPGSEIAPPLLPPCSEIAPPLLLPVSEVAPPLLLLEC